MKTYSGEAIKNLIDSYYEAGGSTIQVEEGCCGWGDWILYNDGNSGLFNFVIKEVYLNEWSSGHTIRRYHKLPKKYQTIVDNQ